MKVFGGVVTGAVAAVTVAVGLTILITVSTLLVMYDNTFIDDHYN